MAPEVARILRHMTPVERRMFRAVGGRLPPVAPEAEVIWFEADQRLPWDQTPNAARRRELAKLARELERKRIDRARKDRAVA